MSTRKQRQRLWASCKQKGLGDAEIRDMIYNATRGRTRSSSQMSGLEIEDLLKTVNGKESPANRMRKKLIAYAHKLGWQLIQDGQTVANMHKIDNWCIKYGQFHKPLNEHTRPELVDLVSQFETVYGSYLDFNKKEKSYG